MTKMIMRKPGYRITLALILLLITAATTSGAELKRTSLQVNNLSCTSCLASIEEALRGLSGAIGMAGDIRTGRVIVDHLADLDEEILAAAITANGYPAEVDWTADIDKRQAITFDRSNRFSSGCGGCSTTGAASDPRVWDPQAAGTGKVSRTIMQVANLSCISCLANIEEALRTIPGTIGMTGDLTTGLVAVDHLGSLSGDQIAAAISGIGYPARIVSSPGNITGKNAKAVTKSSSIASRISSYGCNRRRSCTATASAWKQLYRKYVSKTSNAE
jgi:copper chaperone CopZ